MTGKEIEQICEELNEYAEVQGANLGDVCRMLTQLADYPGYISDNFLKALHEEIKTKLKYFKENYEITKKEVPISYSQTQVFLKRKEN
jgi:ribosomal protein S8